MTQQNPGSRRPGGGGGAGMPSLDPAAGRRTIPAGARRAITAAAAVLARVPPFSELPPVDRAKLAASLEELSYDRGEVIFAEGARADGLYILREGLIERLSGGIRLAVLEPPAVFGDLALLRDEPRSATLVALTPCVLWRLPPERFTRLLRRTPGIGARFAAAVSNRLTSTQREVAELARDFDDLAERLYANLTPGQQQVLEQAALLPVLDSRVLARVLETPSPAELPLADVLLRRMDGATDEGRSALTFQPTFRRFLLEQLEERFGPAELTKARRQLAAAARSAGAAELAIRILVEGGLLAEAVEVTHREVDRLEVAGHPAEARRLAALLPRSTLEDQLLLREVADGGGETAATHREGVPVAPAEPRWRPGRTAVGLALAATALLVGWLTPPPPGLSPAGWHALATLAAIVPLLALETLPEGIVALGLATVWILGGVAPASVALAGFATPSWVLVVTVLGVGAAIAASGVLYRLALWALTVTGGGFRGSVFALALAGLLVSPAVPNATGRVTLIAPATAELVEALGYAPMSRAAAGLAMAVLTGFGQMAAAFLTASSTSVLVFALLPESARAELTWLSWAVRAAPTHLVLLLGLVGATLWLYRPEPEPGSRMADGGGDPPATMPRDGARDLRAQGLALQRELLGPPSRHEYVALGVAAALLAGFVTGPLHGVDVASLGVLALGILAATGALTADGLRSINWSFALLFGILTSMAQVFERVGLDRWLAGLVAGAVGGLTATPVLFVAALTLLCYAVSLVLRWQAAAPLLTIALVPVAGGAGIDPFVVAMVALVACNGFFLPYQSTVYLALYHGTGGRLFSHRQARPAALAYGLVALIALCASVPIWDAMGLL